MRFIIDISVIGILLSSQNSIAVDRNEFCALWFRDFGLNMESQPIHPLVAEFIQEFKLNLKRLSEVNGEMKASQFAIFF